MTSNINNRTELLKGFLDHYTIFRDEFIRDIVVLGIPESASSWISRMSDYNTTGGKLNRGLSVVESAIILADRRLSEEEMKSFYALGWCIEFASFLIGDDIMDASFTRRGHRCWYKREEVGLIAINDCFTIQSILFKTLKRYFGQKACYVPLFDLFMDTKMRTELGQLLDLLTAPPNGRGDFANFTDENYRRIVKFKTAYYSFYLPIVSTLIVLEKEFKTDLAKLEEVLMQLGEFFQVQDDFLDCYGDPKVIGKVGTDVQEGKCSWVILTALKSPNLTLKHHGVLNDHYGRRNHESEKLVKSIYDELDLESEFYAYEKHAEENIRQLITELGRSNSILGEIVNSHMPMGLEGLKGLHKEIQRLQEKPIEGIEVIPDDTDLFSLSLTISGPEASPYQGGKFNVKLAFTDEYPHTPPKGRFITTIFHPNISPSTGDICVNTLQKDWRPSFGLAHLLLTIKSLLLNPNPESALNETAGKLLLDDYDEFCKRATLMTTIHTADRSIQSMTKENQENAESAIRKVSQKTAPSSSSLAETRKKLRRL